jgi:hypothetical protein
VAAEAVVWAAYHKRRALWVGFPCVKTILGTKLVPGFIIDKILVRQGYSGQQTEQPVAPDRPDNLFEPVPGDHGAHGRFDAQAKSRSWQLWMTLHREWVLAAGALAVVAITILLL